MYFPEVKLLKKLDFYLVCASCFNHWPSAVAVGNINKTEQTNKWGILSCRMNPSQMTGVWSHARSHYYITSTVLHHCTECFSMNNTEWLGRERRGHGAWLLNDKRSTHCEKRVIESIRWGLEGYPGVKHWMSYVCKGIITLDTNAGILI